ncbi:MAG: DNA primase [Eubacterium sp.]|nr:DNA primase [Eubacterium sp.]
MYYGDDIIDEVRSANDIVDLIGSYVTLKKAGSNYVGLCPFHNEKTPSFSVSGRKQMYYCFGCGKGGNIYTFLQEYENITFVESVQMLAERAGINLPENTSAPADAKKKQLKELVFEINKKACGFYHKFLLDERGKLGLDYFKSRGLTDETIRKFGLGYAPQSGGNLYRYMKSLGYNDDILKQTGLFGYNDRGEPYDKFWNRVMFPIVDKRNHVIGFGGRVMGDAKPKYLNTQETVVFDKSRNLYGINYIRGKLEHGLVLCEGYMDVIAMFQAGYEFAVAALGTSFTEGHAALIKRMTDRVYICFDSDEAGQKAAIRAIPILKNAGVSAKVISLAPQKDPDEFFKNNPVEAFLDRIDNAKSSFFFEIGYIEKNHDMDDPESKTAFMNEAAGKILAFEDEIERNNYIEAFAREYKVKAEDFKALVAKLSAKKAGIDYEKLRERREQRKSVRKEDAIEKSQGILLTWLAYNPERLDSLKKYINTDDFVDEPYKTVAGIVFEQIEKTGKVDAAGIVSRFGDSEEQSLVAGIFHKEIEDDGDENSGRAIREVVKNIMKYSLDHKSATLEDISQLQELVKKQKELENIKIDI